ncbi:uncharacterized protein AB675_812 [Cyphellophora attinorum]|uniref:Putative membrane protein n=1 Tax=Cyphellophora attinorum TaxID=1664694 RepID=A0A0N1P3H6_9EURO|nr:uncharacterized protein AB675_812 [Phialophora attinorum]KPI45554.1 putative membrane protein [Phialophora attinorum]
MAPSMKGLRRFRRSSPQTQNLISGVALFLTAGIYHAITGLGAGGGKPSSIYVATTTNSILYVLFTVVGFFGGSVLNKIGPKITYTVGLSSDQRHIPGHLIGCFGYPFYATGLWYFDAKGHQWYPLLGGAILGITAGLLWTAANFIQFAYPEEKDKGRFIGMQLFMLATGSTIGAIIPFAINFHSSSASGVPTSVYITFTVIMLSAMLVVFFGIVSPEKVTRDDGTHLAIFEAVEFRTELVHCVELLRDWRILMLLLPLFSTEITLGLIPTLNAHSCNLRTRSLNNLIYWAIQIPSALFFSQVLDNHRLTRRMRGMTALSINVILSVLGWGLAIGIQKRLNLTRGPFKPTLDWSSPEYGWICALMIVFGVLFIINQMLVNWTISALSNDPRIAGRTGGFAKAMLSAGLAVAFGMEAGKAPYMTQTIIQVALQFSSFAMVAIVVWRAVRDTNYLVEATVIPPVHVEMELGISTSAQGAEVAGSDFNGRSSSVHPELKA